MRANALALHAEGKVLVGGVFTDLNGVQRTNLARLNPDGAVDPTFTAETDAEVKAIVVQPDGNILIAGAFTNIAGVPRHRAARLVGKAVEGRRLFDPMREGTRFRASLFPVAGRSYLLEFKDSINSTNWQSLGSVSGNGSVQLVTEPNPPPTQRFYRVREIPP